VSRKFLYPCDQRPAESPYSQRRAAHLRPQETNHRRQSSLDADSRTGLSATVPHHSGPRAFRFRPSMTRSTKGRTSKLQPLLRLSSSPNIKSPASTIANSPPLSLARVADEGLTNFNPGERQRKRPRRKKTTAEANQNFHHSITATGVARPKRDGAESGTFANSLIRRDLGNRIPTPAETQRNHIASQLARRCRGQNFDYHRRIASEIL
jgi:hypothetical protein